MNFNTQVLCVFQPEDKEFYGNRRRFFVKAKKLWWFIGLKNSERILRWFLDSGKDKERYKVQNFGIVDFYLQ